MMVAKLNITNLLSSLGIGKIASFIGLIVLLGLSIASQPRDEVRADADNENNAMEYSNFVLCQDVLLYVLIAPVLLSIMSVALTLFGSKDSALDSVIHGLIGLLILSISSFLLYAAVSLYNFLYDVTLKCSGWTGSRRNAYANDPLNQAFARCELDFLNLNRPNPEGACSCIILTYLKYATTIASGSLGLICALLNLGILGIAISMKKRKQQLLT